MGRSRGGEGEGVGVEEIEGPTRMEVVEECGVTGEGRGSSSWRWCRGSRGSMGGNRNPVRAPPQ
uniref:DUF834 domain-containing protein n=1 Tax=Oryza nivara TaxID=4536 RepID=A0A0E0ILT0_ORYNI